MACVAKVLADGFYFLEGPRWRDDRLWVSDLVGNSVYAVSEGTVDLIVDVPGRPSGLGFLPDGCPIVVSMRDRKLFRIEDRCLRLYADLSSLVEAEINDMVIDQDGRAYVGSYELGGGVQSKQNDGRLILVDTGGLSAVVADGLKFPNGCIVQRSPHRLIVAETFAERLTQFDIRGDGSLGEGSLFADLGDHSPDGICADGSDGFWVASAMKPYFVHVCKNGDIDQRIEFPGRQAIACEMGGKDGNTLFCLTVDEDFEDVDGCDATSRIDIIET